jgi:aerobic carbon-monoxide dehydrogenase medium subunit
VQVPAPFDYVRATSIGNALELLERHGPESRVIAGGHSLLPMMKLRLARPEWLIDINDVAELRHITEESVRSPGTPRCWRPTSSADCSRSCTTPRR